MSTMISEAQAESANSAFNGKLDSENQYYQCSNADMVQALGRNGQKEAAKR
jgi:hypothetical protein